MSKYMQRIKYREPNSWFHKTRSCISGKTDQEKKACVGEKAIKLNLYILETFNVSISVSRKEKALYE